MKWEYMTLQIPPTGFFFRQSFDYDAFTTRLNALGAQSWELVSLTMYRVFNTNGFAAVLKRPAR
jgi:hypothetical protein